MAKKFTAQEILDMAVGLIEYDSEADLDFDGKVTASDARYAMRESAGLKPIEDNKLMAENILNKIMKQSQEFSYDADADKLYSEYKSLYEREGDRAAEDALGLASALTGGYSSSYGLMRARDEKDRFAAELLDKREQLEDKAYARHVDSLDSLYSLYGLLTDLDAKEESKKKAALEFAEAAAKQGDTSFLEALGITPQEKEDPDAAYERAELFAKYGDYSLLKELGVDVSSIDRERLSDTAQLFAKYGDYSLLKELGVDVSALDREELSELAGFFAQYGDYSVLNKLGVNTKNLEAEEYYDRLIKKYKAGL